MFQVEEDAVGRYRISIGVGEIYSTRDVEEVKIAIGHYFAKDSCHLGNNPNCPLCRAINDEMKAMARR